ncbi:MAG TPA: lipopolysaccharide heptosyltransferase II [Desulfomonilaceae bacterium]|nr:lipopolysaccharide heptosyltransferase II [Desulfomonilaceae bacterium]
MPSRILVRGTNWVGDTVMSLPAVKELRKIFPASHITFWLPAGLAPLVSATGIPDDIVSFDSTAGGPLKRSLTMSRVLSEKRFDMAVLLQNAFESAFTCWMAGIPIRAGYPTDVRGPLLSLRIPLTREIREKHQVFYYLGITDHLGNHFGHACTRNGLPDCSVSIEKETLDEARGLLSSAGIAEPFFCLCPGSVNSEAKRWPANHFAALADILSESLAASVVFLGVPGESSLIEGIMESMRTRRAANLAGRGNLLTSMGMMNLSELVISNDTGSAHMAVAASAKVLTVFGPTTPGATAPYGPAAYVLQGEAPCAPCRYFKCPLPDHPCMTVIEPAAVFAKVREIVRDRETVSDKTAAIP